MRRVDAENRDCDELTPASAAGIGGAAPPSSSPSPQPGGALQLTLEADPMELAGLRRSVGRWLSSHGVEEQDRLDITLATSEAAGNSIEHAYGAHGATLTVTCERESALVRITVRDNGHWRDRGPNGRGRGLAIMRALVDSMQITRGERGTTVVLTKSCARAARAAGPTAQRRARGR
jgi:anti-sigma regulatory factor (Ser/Thr protein kinase)